MITVSRTTRLAPARAGAADAVRELLTRHAAASRAEPGCLQFDAHQGIDNPDEFALVERYESQAAFAEHRRTPHFRRNVETELVGLLTARSWTVFGPALRRRPLTCSPSAIEIDLDS